MEPGDEPPRTGPWQFFYTAGRYRYVLRNDATIETLASNTMDSVSSRAYLTYDLTPEGDGMLITGTIDSFTVNAGDSIPLPLHDMSFPIAFDGRMDRSGRIQEFSSPDTSSCGSAAGALLGIARELLIAVPSELTIGLEWRDSTSTTSCRGDIPMTVTTTRHHRLEELIDSAGIPLLRIARQTDVVMSGMGTRPVQATTVSGTGSGSMELLIEPTTGTFRHAVGESLTTLTFDAASRRETFLQRVRLTIELLEKPD